MGAPDAVRELVRRFSEHREAYRSGRYNETQLRREFLDPFFEALGWDVNNRQSYAEAYKEVIHEDAVKVGGLTKAPDYSFRIGGARKFFVEAKKPSISIKDDPAPAFQLRRYAWSAKLPLSILTDFDEFAVYDCRTRPDKTDKSSAGRILYVTADEYDTRWEEIAGVFAREAVLKGSFDRHAAAGAGAKRGTTSVDAAFLAEIEGWRDLLARGIALRNPDLSQPELNFAVQRTIDRIIFLRICEDRGIEDYGALLGLVNGENVYGRLRELYRRADERYNSGLFHFRSEKDRAEHPDTLTPRLAIDDKPLKEIIRGLYYPDSPYEFSVLPADILGQVYEQFLGKVIRLTAGHRAVVEEKPEVKKAGGVYYTPTYIVDYIVKNTVGRLLEGKTPKTAAALRILDPACGSGSFLIGAYQHLLDWHRDWYVGHDPAKWSTGRAPVLRQAQGGGWGLTTAERKRILVNNIYGVDIDSQAVEVTKLSLLLKVLEGENEETLARQLQMFHERALPDLGKNIKCGNSLISPDFFDGRLAVDDAERNQINAFDWPAEFLSITKAGGFDVVIGNPPYYKVSGNVDPLQLAYFKNAYRCSTYKTDLYALFAERSFQLLKQGGLHSFIVPNSFLAGTYLFPVRELLAERHTLIELILFKNVKVFAAAKLDSVIYLASNALPPATHVMTLRLSDESLISESNEIQRVALPAWLSAPKRELRATAMIFPPRVLEKMWGVSLRLGELASVHLGLVLASNDLLSAEKIGKSPDPILMGRDVGRFAPIRAERFFSFSNDPIVGGTKRASVYACGPRLVMQAIRNLKLKRRLVATIAPAGMFTMGTLHNIIVRRLPLSPFYVLGILNSDLLNSYYAAHFPEHRIKGSYLEDLPIRTIDFSNSPDKRRHDEIVALVERMLDLHKKLPVAQTDQEKTAVQRQIADTDRRIDRLVYDLYGLTEDEINIVEGTA